MKKFDNGHVRLKKRKFMERSASSVVKKSNLLSSKLTEQKRLVAAAGVRPVVAVKIGLPTKGTTSNTS